MCLPKTRLNKFVFISPCNFDQSSDKENQGESAAANVLQSAFMRPEFISPKKKPSVNLKKVSCVTPKRSDSFANSEALAVACISPLSGITVQEAVEAAAAAANDLVGESTNVMNDITFRANRKASSASNTMSKKERDGVRSTVVLSKNNPPVYHHNTEILSDADSHDNEIAECAWELKNLYPVIDELPHQHKHKILFGSDPIAC